MTMPKVESKVVEPRAEIGRLYEAGRYLSAYRMAEREGILGATGDTDPDTALLAAKLMAQVGGLRRGRLLDRAMPPSEARAWCAARHIEEFGDGGQKVRFLFFLAFTWKWMRAQTSLWGAAGYCLLAFDLASATRWWLSDFRERQGVLPWMLLNLVRAMMSLGQVRAAWTVCREAIELPPDQAVFMHQLISAVPRAVEGRLDEASSAVALAWPSAQDPEARFLAGLAEAVIAFRRDDLSIAERRSNFADAASQLWSDYPVHKATNLCHRHYRDTVWLLREEDEDGARLWRELNRLPSPWS